MGWVLMSERELNRIVVLSEVIDGRHRPARLDGKPSIHLRVASPVHRML
jgi:hypothetical protein